MRYAAALGAVVLAALVGGCAADETAPAEVRPLASGSASADATIEARPDGVPMSSNPTAVVEGDAAPSTEYPATVDGASAFAREYVRLIGLGFANATSEPLRRRSAQGCEGCEALMQAMDEAERAGLRQRGGEYDVSSVATPPFDNGDVVLLLTYSREASEIVNAAGDTVDRAAAVPETTVQMRLIYGPAGWMTQGYRIV